MFKPFRQDDRMTSQSGSILTAAMGVVVLVGTLSYTAYSLLSGPVRSAAIVTLKTKAQNELILASKLLMRAAADGDADLVLEPPAADMSIAAVAATNGGGIPLTVGAEKIDPWRTPYAYCGWNHGGTNTGVTGLLDGDAVSYDALLAIALISAGPDRVFQTVCNNGLGTITAGGDDIVMRYTYEQAVSIELWKESSTPGTIETSNPSQSVGIGKTADPLYKLDVLGNSMMNGNLTVSAAVNANSLTAGTVDINGGTIDATSIGTGSRSAGYFTILDANAGTSTVGLTATGSISLTGSGGLGINSVPIGGSVAAAGRFTNLTWTGTMTPPNSTLVSNLNADLLDGQHGAFYQDASNLNAGTLPVARTPAYQGDVAKVQGDDYTFIESFQGYPLKISSTPGTNNVMGWDSSNKVWMPMKITVGTGGAGVIGVGGVNILATDPDFNSCSTGQIPKYAGGNDWKCDSDLTGITSIVLSGDVTGTGSSSITTTIANDAVTFAKMQNIPTASLIGRYTAATGDPQSITLGAGLALSGGGVLSASGVSTGATVSGGNANSVLYLNNSGQLATSPNFTYNTTTNSFLMSINGAGISVDGANNGSNISINDTGKYILFSPDAKLSMVLDRGGGTYGMGDISNSANNTIFRMEDATKTISISTKVNGIATSDVLLADAANGVYRFGDIRGGGGVFMDINGVSGAIGFNVGPTPLVTIGPALLKLDYLTGVPGVLAVDPFGNVSSTSMPVGLTDGDKGDITVTGSGATWTIDNNVVTFAKMQDIATARLVGRTTAGSGDPELITVGSGLTLSAGTLSANAVGVSDGDKGDITVSGSGATWTLDNDVVTLAKLQNIATTSLIGRSTAGAGDPEVISIGTGLTLAGGTLSASGGAATWGAITGTLSDQTDLQTELDAKVDENAPITGATKTKITYDAKGLVTAGADATTADIADSTDRRYVTDAQVANIVNLSGVNSGDQTITLTGPVTGTGTGSIPTTITDDAVTFAKIQNIATDKLLGRSTAGTGDVEEITIGSGLSLVGGTLSAANAAPAWGDITGTLSDQLDLQAALDTKVESVTGLMTDNTDPLNPVIQLAVDGVTITGSGTFADPLVAATSVADGDKGDVTVSASGATWTVDNDVVSFAKMQNIATDKLLGRSTAGSGDPEEITIGAGLTLSAGTLTASGSGPGGSDTHVQFNDGGSAFGGEANFTWNKTTKRLFVGDVGGGNNTYLDVNDSTKAIDINSSGTIRLGDIANDVNGTIISISDPQSKIFTTRKLEVPDVAYAIGWDGDPSVPTKNAVYDKVETITPFTVEAAQDALGAMVDSSLVYVDATPLLTRAALTGDVTATQGSNATTIANNAVTFAKMQDIATARLIGRTTAGSGDPELISIGSGLSLAGGILSASSSALSIGDPVASSTANAVLYVDAGNNLGNSSAFTYDGNALIAGNGKNFLNLDHAGQIYKIGDIDGNKNFTHMVINDSSKRFEFTVAGKDALILDAGNLNYQMGDISGIGASTLLTIDDATKSFRLSDGGNNRYIFEPSALTVPHLGDGATTRMLTVDKDGIFIPATMPAALTDGDKGDITVSGSGAAWAVDNNVVTFAKMQDIATARLVGRSTAGSGDPELITIGSGLSLAGGTLSASGGGSGTVTSVNITAPAAGITASGGPVTSSGSITLALADDLAAVEGLSTNGMVARTASNTWTTRTITAGDATVSITNGDGVSGNPTISMARTINTQTGTTYTLVIADAQKVVETSNAAAVTITIPPNASVAFPVGTFIDFVQYGAGQITLAPGAGVTLRSFASSLKTAGQYAVITAYKRATDEWVITGNTQ